MIPLYGELNIGSIGVINVPHETYHLRQNEYDWLAGKLKDNGKIVSLMDNDNTGKKEAIWLRNNYRIIPLLIHRSYKSKDFSELVANNKFKDVSDLVMVAIKYINSYDRKDDKPSWDTTEQSNIVPF